MLKQSEFAIGLLNILSRGRLRETQDVIKDKALFLVTSDVISATAISFDLFFFLFIIGFKIVFFFFLLLFAGGIFAHFN